MKIKELKEKNDIELKSMLDEKKDTVLTLRFDISTKQAKNNQAYKNTKKDIARIFTILTERESKK